MRDAGYAACGTFATAERVPLATMKRHVGSAFSASSAVKTSQIRNLNGANGMNDVAGNAAR